MGKPCPKCGDPDAGYNEHWKLWHFDPNNDNTGMECALYREGTKLERIGDLLEKLLDEVKKRPEWR